MNRAPFKESQPLTITKPVAWDYGTERRVLKIVVRVNHISQVELSRVKSLLLEEIPKMQQSTINQQNG